MNPDFLLRVIVALAGFALKTSVAFGACVALSRLLQAANLRFVVWSGFVYGSAMYWLYLAYALWTPHQQVASAVAGLLQPANASVGAWQIPGSWALPLGFTLRVIGMLYSLTVGYLIFCHVRKRHYLHWVLSLATEPPQQIEQGFRTLAKELHAGRATLLILSGMTSPATFGWLRPTILLPLACVEEDRFQLEDILRHELHHVQRWDALWNGLAIASRGLLFFHPAVRYAVRKMHIERELACDLAVVSHSPVRRADYAECLLRFARLNVTPETNSWGLDFAASANHLGLRIQSILAGQKKSPPWLRSLQIASGLTISALFLNVVPSLALFVTFSRPLVRSIAFTSADSVPAQALVHEGKAGRSARLYASPVNTRRDTVEATSQVGVDAAATALQTDPSFTMVSPLSGAGPQLHHRGDAPARADQGGSSQTIALGSTDAGDDATKAQDRKQALQQTATAALGIYKRLAPGERR